MKLAIITIATRKYKDLLKPLVKSSEKHFMPGHEKHYFLFTDEKLDWFDDHLHTWTQIEHEKWPFITLKRFHSISKVSHLLKEYDMIIYIDADMEFVSDVTTFDQIQTPYFAVCHPSNVFDPNFWTVETNPKSTAFISEPKKIPYIQGCLWGARGTHIMELIEMLKQNVDKDLENSIIAVWHDESHLNRIFNSRAEKLSVLYPGLAYPEKWNLPGIQRIVIHKDKTSLIPNVHND
jgi:Glycosyltransferase family 6